LAIPLTNFLWRCIPIVEEKIGDKTNIHDDALEMMMMMVTIFTNYHSFTINVK
jgi:hypothetical protein